jgi:hypothetical protein
MSEDRDSTAYLVGFLSSFTLLIERELLAIRQSVVTTVEAVMQGIEDISTTVEKNKIDAEQILEFTYLHPDKETEVLIDDVQQLTDEVIENAFKQMHDDQSGEASVSTGKPEAAVQAGLTRLNAKLGESMGRLSKLDDSLSTSVFSIVGALSSEDLIAQRLEHTILSLKSLQTGLSFILIDYEERCRSEEIERVVKSILTYTYRQYTAEEEKERFRAIFGKIAV